MNTQNFLDNFGHLADTPNGIQKLRELILQLAVQGKLVPQDLSDEPASVLLEKIKAEKPLPVITADEVPYALPKGWEWVRFEKIFSLEYGDNLPADKRSNTGEFPVYGSNGIVGTHNVSFVNAPCIVVGRKGSAGALNLSRSQGCCVTDVAYYCIPPAGIDLSFSFKLFHTLGLESLGKGIKPGLNRNEAYALIVAVPPLPEQHRIVTKVDQLMALCDELEERKQRKAKLSVQLNNASLDRLLNAESPDDFNTHWQRIYDNFQLLYDNIENVNKLRSAILQLAVQGKLVPQDPSDEPASVLLDKIKAEKAKMVKEGKIRKLEPLPPINKEDVLHEVPETWDWVRLGELGITQTGSTPSTSNPEFFGTDYPFIKPADISDKGVRYNSGEGLSKKGIENGRFIKEHSILMVCIGGSISKVNFIDRDCSCNQQINTITPYTGVAYRLLTYFMASPYFKSQVMNNASSTTLPILSKGKWEVLPIPLPPSAEQTRIVAKIDQLMALCDELEARLKQYQADGERLMESVVNSLAAA